MFKTFRWSSNDPDVVAKAKLKVADVKHKGGKSAIDFDTLVWLSDGLRVSRREPCSYATGFAWFYRTSRAFQVTAGNSDRWRVLPEVEPEAKPEHEALGGERPSRARCASSHDASDSHASLTHFHPMPAFKLLRGCFDRRVVWGRQSDLGPLPPMGAQNKRYVFP